MSVRLALKKQYSGIALLVAIGLAMSTSLPAVAKPQELPPGRVYTVSMVATGLAQHAQSWSGRTVLVRAKIALLGRVYLQPSAGTYVVSLVLVPPAVALSTRKTPSVYKGPQLQVLAPKPPAPWKHVGSVAVFRLLLFRRHACPVGQCAESPDAQILTVYP